MSDTESSPYHNQEDTDHNLCVVCCKTVETYSVGSCDHPVCSECSTRMRVLCSQNECPICRAQLPKVIFTKTIAPFSTLLAQYQNTHLQDRKYGMIFTSEDIKRAYIQLLEFRCDICTKNGTRKCLFYTFQQLKDHMRREHALLYCELCVENLKIFAAERRCYTKQELGYHRRKGDADDKSHRGHPLCEFCDTRFMDSDELFRHLRRNHLFCHFCDADGKHQYYNAMDDLRKHFRDEHYLCEEGDCTNMPLVAVYRTDIDLKAHIATEHSRFLSKSANKQARTLELAFTLAPRPGAERNKKQGQSRGERSDEEGAVGYDLEPGGPGGGVKQMNALTSQDFPALGNGNTTVMMQSRPTTTVNFMSKMNPFRGDDFPSLGGARSSAVTITTNSASTSRKKPPEVTITRTLRGGSAQNLTKTTENFPHLNPTTANTSTVHLSVNNSQNSAPKVSIHVSHNGGSSVTHISSSNSKAFNINQKPTEAFPALGKKDGPTMKNPQWVAQKPKKTPQEPKTHKVAPAPQLPSSSFSEFPTLSKKPEKKSSSVTVPVSATWLKDHKPNNNSNNNNINHKNNNNNSKNEPSTSKSAENVDKNKAKKQKKKTKDATTTEEMLNNIENQNGIVKKRSELKIGSLLAVDSEATSNTSKPPPGFPAKPPPGLTNQDFPTLTASNDLTFTNSTGQSYSIKPNNYHQPSNFQQRNQNLIKRVMALLDNDLMKDFKEYSTAFRNGTISAPTYYEYCQAILGAKCRELFPELLVLLPDVAKQQALYHVCNDAYKTDLVVCENCKQIVMQKELTEHYNYHALESHFPSLGTNKNDNANNAWSSRNQTK